MAFTCVTDGEWEFVHGTIGYMDIEKNLLTNAYAYLTDAAGAYVTAHDATPPQAFVTPNARLTSKDRHVTTRSTGASVVARSSGRDVFSRGGTQPLVSPKSPLIVG
jgi:hypothetical protein